MFGTVSGFSSGVYRAFVTSGIAASTDLVLLTAKVTAVHYFMVLGVIVGAVMTAVLVVFDKGVQHYEGLGREAKGRRQKLERDYYK